MESISDLDHSHLVGEELPPSDLPRLAANDVDASRDPRKRSRQNDSALSYLSTDPSNHPISKPDQPTTKSDLASPKEQIRRPSNASPLSSAEQQLLHSLRTSTASARIPRSRRRDGSPTLGSRPGHPSDKRSSTAPTTRSLSSKSSVNHRDGANRANKSSQAVLLNSNVLPTTKALSLRKGLRDEELVAVVSNTPLSKIARSKRPATIIAALPFSSSPRRSPNVGETVSRLLSDSRGEIEYVRGFGMKRVDNDMDLGTSSTKAVSSRKFDSEDSTFSIKSISTRARHAVMKELMWIAKSDNFAISLNDHDRLILPADDIDRVSYNMDISSMYLALRKHEIRSILSAEVILVVNEGKHDPYRLRSLLEKRIGAVKVSRVAIKFFESKEHEFEVSRSMSLPPLMETIQGSTAQDSIECLNLSPYLVEQAPNKEGNLEQHLIVDRVKSSKNTVTQHQETSQANDVEVGAVQKPTLPLQQSLASTVVNSEATVQPLNTIRVEAYSRVIEDDRSPRIGSYRETSTEDLPVPRMGIEIRVPSLHDLDIELQSKSRALTLDESHNRTQREEQQRNEPTSKANPSSSREPEVSLQTSKSPSTSNSKKITPNVLAGDTSGLLYKDQELVKLHDLVIRVRDVASMSDGRYKFDKLDVYDGPWRIIQLPRTAATPKDLFHDPEKEELQGDFEASKGAERRELMHIKKLVKLEFPPGSKAEAWTSISRLRPVYEIPNDAFEAEARMLYYQGKDLDTRICRVSNTDFPARMEEAGSSIGVTGVSKIQRGAYIKIHHVISKGPNKDGTYEVEKLRGKRMFRCRLEDYPEAVTDMKDPMISRYLRKKGGTVGKNEAIVVQYLVHWAGWPSEDDTWEVGRGNIPKVFINAFDANSSPSGSDDPGDEDMAITIDAVDQTAQHAQKKRKTGGKKVAVIIDSSAEATMPSPKRKATTGRKRKS